MVMGKLINIIMIEEKNLDAFSARLHIDVVLNLAAFTLHYALSKDLLCAHFLTKRGESFSNGEKTTKIL